MGWSGHSSTPLSSSALAKATLHMAWEEVERLLRERQEVAGQGYHAPAPFRRWKDYSNSNDDNISTEGDRGAVG